MPEQSNSPLNFWQELKRRKVIRVIIGYAASAFIILEAVDIIFPRMGLPDWTVTLVIFLLIIGFIFAIILSWIFDVTPEGLKKTESAKVAKEKEIKPIKRRLKVSDGIIAVLVVVVCILLYPKIFKNNKFEDLKDEDGRISVAVMPFENLTGDSTLNFWQRGISEILINELGGSSELLVRSSQTMSELFESMGQAQSESILPTVANDAARKLKTSIYVTGKYQRTETKIRILVNIVNTEDETILWTDKVEGNLEYDFIELGDSISNLVKNHLEIFAFKQVVDVEFRDAFTKSADAYKFYINGINHFWNKEKESARQYFTEAINIDSTFAMAMFYLAWTHFAKDENSELTAFWIKKAHENKDDLPLLFQNWISAWFAYHVSKSYDDFLKYLNLLKNSDMISRLFWHDVGTFYYYICHDFENAVYCYDKILEINEEWDSQWEYEGFYTGGVFWYDYVHPYHKIGEYDKLEKLFEIGLNLFPENHKIIFRQAVCALSQKDSLKATEYMNHFFSVRNDIDSAEYLKEFYLAKLYSLTENYDLAKEHFRSSLSLNPDYYPSLSHFAEMLIMNDIDIDLGMEINQKALDINPNSPSQIRLQGYGYYKQGKYEESLEILKYLESFFFYFRWNVDYYQYMQDLQQILDRQESEQ